jgi:signal transduction histidine kinase
MSWYRTKNVFLLGISAAGAHTGATFLKPENPPVRLSNFIRENIESILQEWEDFAVTLQPLAQATQKKLRDHAEQMLLVICKDLDTYQCEADSIEKSKGNAPDAAADTAAEVHAEDRVHSGFAIEELMAEYRAVRSTVLRLWQRRVKHADELAVQDMLRFNEAIDQALAESVARYSEMMRDSQNVFLAILGHDVRNPLGSIAMGAQVLLQGGALPEKSVAIARRIQSSTQRINELVSDLIDFSTGNLGSGMPVKPASMDFGAEARKIVDEIRGYHPERKIVVELEGDLNVIWDRSRMNQALSNLIGNAVQHGEKDHPVWVAIKGGEKDVVLSVQNMGARIDPAHLRAMFDPAKRFSIRSASERSSSDRDNLGLGLYITREIVSAHGGEIRVSSTDAEGTMFTVTLPREVTPAAAGAPAAAEPSGDLPLR